MLSEFHFIQTIFPGKPQEIKMHLQKSAAELYFIEVENGKNKIGEKAFEESRFSVPNVRT
jgi:hypothetical protein